MKKDHAEHNKSLCDELLAQGKYNDWVVTTAFYSSIHFVDHKIFQPSVTINGTVVFDIVQAHRIARQPSKHKTREYLVAQFLSSQIANYRFLADVCWNARYFNYRISASKAKVARQRLEQIIAACI